MSSQISITIVVIKHMNITLLALLYWISVSTVGYYYIDPHDYMGGMLLIIVTIIISGCIRSISPD